MRGMRGIRRAALAAVLALGAPAVAAPSEAQAATGADPAAMRATGGGTQLITVRAASARATTALVQWWTYSTSRRRWVLMGQAAGRVGARGLVAGTQRRMNTYTTPTGLFDLPFAFGDSAPPAGTRMPYRRPTRTTWWCEDAPAKEYNRWVDPLPRDCRASESERLAASPVQYARAVLIGFNYAKPVKGRGAGIFLHVNGHGATAGCVSVPANSMSALLKWLDPKAHPHIAIGAASGALALNGY
ncbi:L,D-transpeptidase family protein [Streptacidiphilus monticola]|uniref:L,D-transpeptidase family protein n=1 Tax=Streptacidiphilus monticola TaxID=2161674 RepID=A0ABW1G6Y7_9ACTN